MEQLVDIVGVNIREIRKQKKLTQEELAEKSELQTSYLAGVERGDRNITLQTSEKTDLVRMFSHYLEGKSEKEIKLIIEIARMYLKCINKSLYLPVFKLSYFP